MIFVFLLILGVMLVSVLALTIIFYNNRAESDVYLEIGPDPDEIDIREEYGRCTIRSDRAGDDWIGVQIDFYLPNARRSLRQFRFDRWTRAGMNGFEDRLVEAGFLRTASGSSDPLGPGFQQVQRYVIFTREQQPYL